MYSVFFFAWPIAISHPRAQSHVESNVKRSSQHHREAPVHWFYESKFNFKDHSTNTYAEDGWVIILSTLHTFRNIYVNIILIFPTGLTLRRQRTLIGPCHFRQKPKKDLTPQISPKEPRCHVITRSSQALRILIILHECGHTDSEGQWC